MGTSNTGPVNCCLAQMLLTLKKITTIEPKELAEMLGVHPISAGYILAYLSWRRETRLSRRAIYHYEGYDKIFTGTVLGHARRRLGRLLGISREEVLEVLA